MNAGFHFSYLQPHFKHIQKLDKMEAHTSKSVQFQTNSIKPTFTIHTTSIPWLQLEFTDLNNGCNFHNNIFVCILEFQ